MDALGCDVLSGSFASLNPLVRRNSLRLDILCFDRLLNAASQE